MEVSSELLEPPPIASALSPVVPTRGRPKLPGIWPRRYGDRVRTPGIDPAVSELLRKLEPTVPDLVASVRNVFTRWTPSRTGLEALQLLITRLGDGMIVGSGSRASGVSAVIGTGGSPGQRDSRRQRSGTV
jgi:hypothetical protein